MADVTFTRKDFDKAKPIWQMLGDVCEGQDAVKRGGDNYLPRPNPIDQSEDNKARFKQYLTRAVFYNVTGRTLEGLNGAVFRKLPVYECGVDIEADVDGSGVTIHQQSQGVLQAVLCGGRRALWVDYPEVEGPVTVARQQSENIKPKIIDIDALQVGNWKLGTIDGKVQLVLVVIHEVVQEATEDGFGAEDIEQYRVLRLDEEGYTVEVHRKTGGGWTIYSSSAPLDGKGNRWRSIPFTFVGSKNNDAVVDKAPLYDMAVLNIAHYRNSADYEDSCYMVGQAQPYMTNVDDDWREYYEKNKIYIGSRNVIMVPEGGTFGFAQADPNIMPKEGMEHKERQMAALGARLLMPGEAVKTATEAQSDNEAEHSVLSLVAENVSSAYTKALQWAEKFYNVSENGSFSLNTDFLNHALDAQMLLALMQAWQAGGLPEDDLFDRLRLGGLIAEDKDNEAVKAEIASNDAGLGLDDPAAVA